MEVGSETSYPTPPVVRDTPRMSVNKLGEYMQAGVSRRRKIIQQQREPKPFIGPRYTAAARAIASFLVTREESVLDAFEAKVRAQQPKSKWKREQADLLLEAVASFRRMAGSIVLPPGAKFVTGSPKPKKLKVRGVELSVCPDLLVRTASHTGALKLVLSKTKSYQLTAKSAEYVGTCLHHFVEATQGEASTKLCFVVDVFQGVVFKAPTSYRRRRQEVEDACDEIARGWLP